MIGKHPPES
ncbi:39322cd7-549c-4a33-892f-57cd00210907 [Thermothielavioides terrestris]|uniref:39322cd7-549c-4a33-892f-57cd00210907 n=1 Tax=Thermothielavioides terrestris TaxID=2587410 RepID=A0A446BCF0_9PEZI|nr:39322cd7-549c-4a33-892f-57cd00210907 [Thermothielavioides terrestris]